MVLNKAMPEQLENGSRVKILLADDHKLLREALKYFLEKQPDFIVVGEASSGDEAVRLAADCNPHVIIMDISMPNLNGIQATMQIKEKNPRIAVLALSVHSDREHILGILEAGAAGYLTKNVASDKVIAAVKAVASGETILPPEIFHQIFKYGAWATKPIHSDLVEKLTDREWQIVKMVAKCKCNKDIAEELNLSIRTVKGYLVNIFSKLRVGSRTELITLGLRTGLLTIKDLE